MCEESLTAVSKIMHSCGMPLYGVAPFDALKSMLIQCSALRRLPKSSKSIITAVFPYYSSCPAGEISRYAMVKDYHIVVGEKLDRAVSMFREKFDGFIFEPFCDASPISEVTAAHIAGLGVLGRNGLLITPRFGSFVFIGEIVTDIELPPCEKSGGTCASCGRCASACPSGAITPDGIDKKRCISHLTQQKGDLAPSFQQMIKQAGTIWGCDICQNVCPMNRDIEETYIDEFKKNIVSTLSQDDIDDENFESKYAQRAFMWRGKKVLKRNIGILHSAPDNNITVENK